MKAVWEVRQGVEVGMLNMNAENREDRRWGVKPERWEWADNRVSSASRGVK